MNIGESGYFLKLVEYEAAKNSEHRKNIEQEIKNFPKPIERDELDLLKLKAMSAWYYIPAMEMLHQPHYQDNLEGLARDLGIAPPQLDEVITTLLQLGLIENIQGQFQKTNSYILFSSEDPHQSLKKFHSQMLRKSAARAL